MRTQNFPKNQHFLHPNMHRHILVPLIDVEKSQGIVLAVKILTKNIENIEFYPYIFRTFQKKNWISWLWLSFICHFLCNSIPFVQSKKVKNTHGRVILLVKLQNELCIVTLRITPPWVFSAFFKLYKWEQIGQNVSYMSTVTLRRHDPISLARNSRQEVFC